MALSRAINDWRDQREVWEAVAALPPEAILIWQYVPHMYGRGGVSPVVPETMRRWKARGGRQMALAHELYGPWSFLPNRWWYARQQRKQWRQIRALADAIGMSTEAWLIHEGAEGSDLFFFCPSPSSIPIVEVSASHGQEWRAEQGWPAECKVAGVFGSLGPLSRWRWVEQACQEAHRSGVDVRLVTFGQSAYRGGGIEAARHRSLGFVDERTVSEALQACDVLVVPYIDGISERRTSAMAGFAHGCCVATTRGSSTGPTLGGSAFFHAPETPGPGTFAAMVSALLRDDAVRRETGARAREAYRERYDWPVVARRIGEVIGRLASRGGIRS